MTEQGEKPWYPERSLGFSKKMYYEDKGLKKVGVANLDPGQNYINVDINPAGHNTKANLLTSLVKSPHGDNFHAPVLDIDIPCALIPSAQPGHSHLLIDKLLTWDQYKNLMMVLAECGIIEQGYYAAACTNGMSGIRVPGEGVKFGLTDTQSERIKRQAKTQYDNYKLKLVVKELYQKLEESYKSQNKDITYNDLSPLAWKQIAEQIDIDNQAINISNTPAQLEQQEEAAF